MNFALLLLLCLAIGGNDWPLEMPIYVSGHSLQPKIKSGQDAQRYQFPHQASLQIENRHVCGGALVSEDSVLTTCKCVQMLKAKEGSRVVLGALNLEQDETDAQVRNISNYIEHFGCGMHDGFEIGILRLDKPVTVTEAVRPIKLTNCSDCDTINVNVTLSGWGAITADMRPTLLQWVDLVTVTCRDPMSEAMAKHVICTCGSEDEFQGFGNGDSGTPLIRKSTGALMGVALRVIIRYPVPDPRHHSLHVNVCPVQKWIKEIAGL